MRRFKCSETCLNDSRKCLEFTLRIQGHFGQPQDSCAVADRIRATDPFSNCMRTRIPTDGYHNLSHHGQATEKVKQLEDADRQQMALPRELLHQLAERRDGGQRLLDNTMVLYGSNMGDSNTHDNTNLPILLAGGGFRHGQHLASRKHTPLCNLYVSMLQRLGVETDRFASSTGTLTGLNPTA